MWRFFLRLNRLNLQFPNIMFKASVLCAIHARRLREVPARRGSSRVPAARAFGLRRGAATYNWFRPSSHLDWTLLRSFANGPRLPPDEMLPPASGSPAGCGPDLIP